jgi:hypothetical protein
MPEPTPPHHQHDNSYKSLFSHPEMVRDLIVGFLPAEWVQDFDMNSLERKNDIIWRPLLMAFEKG